MADDSDKGVVMGDEMTLKVTRDKESRTLRLISNGLAETHVVRPGRVLEVYYDSGRVAVWNKLARGSPPSKEKIEGILMDHCEEWDNLGDAADQILGLFGVAKSAERA